MEKPEKTPSHHEFGKMIAYISIACFMLVGATLVNNSLNLPQNVPAAGVIPFSISNFNKSNKEILHNPDIAPPSETNQKIIMITSSRSGITETFKTLQSTDGKTWTEITSPPQQISSGRSIVFNNLLWVVGGSHIRIPGFEHNWVFMSPDGNSWSVQTTDSEWSARQGHEVIVFNNKLYLLGGQSFDSSGFLTNTFNDVWVSGNGKDWIELSEESAWRKRISPAVTVFQDKIWILGGDGVFDNPDCSDKSLGGGEIYYCSLKDVWAGDGENWSRYADLPETMFDVSFESSGPIIYNDKMWLFDGFGSVWTTQNGEGWQKILTRGPWYTNGDGIFAPFVFNGKVWIIGNEHRNDVLVHHAWSSIDGITWQQEIGNIPVALGHGVRSVNVLSVGL